MAQFGLCIPWFWEKKVNFQGPGAKDFGFGVLGFGVARMCYTACLSPVLCCLARGLGAKP